MFRACSYAHIRSGMSLQASMRENLKEEIYSMLVNMNDVLLPAKEQGYGVGFFNATSLEAARAVIETAEELRAPVMIGTAEVLLPTTSLSRTADILVPMAKAASVPVCIHYDHGLTFEGCMNTVRAGFTSVMYDCSTLSYEDNVQALAEMVKICHAVGVTVEGELGHVGDNAGTGKLANPSDYYTDPARALDFVTRTGVDALAVAVGNAHGDYAFPPKLDFGRIEQIAKDTGLPLVLHGGSGISDEDFRTAVKKGICKINIYTDMNKAGVAGLKKGMEEGVHGMTELIPYSVAAMKAVVAEKLRLFGSVGRA